MREIKFRGKDLKGEHWWYGSLAYFPDSQTYHIIPCGSCKNGEVICDFVEVEKDTIGQFTGFYGKHKQEIFEGDILKLDGKLYKVEFRHGSFCYPWDFITKYDQHQALGADHRFDFSIQPYNPRVRIIGNFHDNPELL